MSVNVSAATAVRVGAVFTAAGQATEWMSLRGEFHVSVQGGFTGLIVLQRRLPDGAGGYRAVETATAAGSAVAWSAPCAEVLNSGRSDGVQFRLYCQDLSAGTPDVLILQ